MERIEELAAANLQALSKNRYPGRLIVLGRTPCGDPVQIYSIMGRSEGSRNRIFELAPNEPSCVRTRIADESKISGDPSLLIYNAMREDGNGFVVSNGLQTDSVMMNGTSALKGWHYEPDSPNFTPRITGVTRVSGDRLDIRLIMLRKSSFGGACERFYYDYDGVEAGYGYLISTYDGDGDPLPSFSGEPLIMPIESNDPAEIASMFWVNLNEDNKVALATKVIRPGQSSQIEIINRY